MKRWKATSLKRKQFLSSSDTESDSDPTNQIPTGFLTIYVGLDRHRFLIPTRYLNFPVFVALLKKAEEEYGFKFSGGIVLPCELEFFSEVLKLLNKDEQKFAKVELDDFLKMFSQVDMDSLSCQKGNHSCYGFTPIMQES